MAQINDNLLTLIGIAAASLQTVLLALAGFVAWFQLRETAKTRYLEAVIRMFDDFGSRQAYFEADAILGLPRQIEEFTPEEIELAAWSVRVYEKMGFLVDSAMIPAKYIVPLYSRRIVWAWDALLPYIQEQRRLRDTGGAYRMAGDAAHFENLHKLALRYRTRHLSHRVHPPIPLAYRARLKALVESGQPLLPSD
ncbi:MAG: hypothetical protein ACM3N4_04125 [Nitrososphaerota archaeon]